MHENIPPVSGIYMILNTTNGKFYLGSAVHARKRVIVHKAYLCKGSHHSRALQSAWNKYGAEAFTAVFMAAHPPEELLYHEQLYLDALEPKYNMAPTAGSGAGVKLSDEVKRALSARMSARIAANPEAHLELCRRAREGITEDSKRRIAEKTKARHALRRANDPELQAVMEIAKQRGVTDLKSLKYSLRKDPAKRLAATPRHRNQLITFDGRSLTKKGWAEFLGVSSGAITNRLKKYPLEQALSMPGNYRLLVNGPAKLLDKT